MFQLLKRKSEEERLRSHYQKFMHEAFLLSEKDKRVSKSKTAEADAILTKLNTIKRAKGKK